MGDAAIAVVVSGAVTIVTMIVGFLTLWVKLKYSADKAEEAVAKAEVVEAKIDHNTATTKSVEAKADTIVEQTNGSLEKTKLLVSHISDRVSKLEDYNRESSHRILDALNTICVKIERLLVMQSVMAKDVVEEESKG